MLLKPYLLIPQHPKGTSQTLLDQLKSMLASSQLLLLSLGGSLKQKNSFDIRLKFVLL